MKRYSKKNLAHIQTLVEQQTGVTMKNTHYHTRRPLLLVSCLACLSLLCAFAWVKFSGLNGDEAGFAAVYQGDGRYAIVVENYSDKVLKLQDKVKVMQWSTGKAVTGDTKKIRMTTKTIAPHEQDIISIDLSAGYDVEAMANDLPEGDSYYFVLTNNDFAFGQDWMCFFDMTIGSVEAAQENLSAIRELATDKPTVQYGSGDLRNTDWTWPTVSQAISVFFGEQANGNYADHINIAGAAGDDIYAVSDGIIVTTGFEKEAGNIIILDVGEGILVKYGHLATIEVSEGETIEQGQVIATLGKTGMATGANLLFAMTVDGEAIDPLREE